LMFLLVDRLHLVLRNLRNRPHSEACR
jgi:hypothetical protein